jgi:hypothetical protein
MVVTRAWFTGLVLVLAADPLPGALGGLALVVGIGLVLWDWLLAVTEGNR